MSYQKPAFVLVHGAWEGPETWSALSALLVAAGHPVYAPDLGQGADVSQKSRTDRVVLSVEQAYDTSNQPVALVGHSLGGLTVSEVAEARPERIATAVFVCAYMIAPGLTVSDVRRRPSMAGSLVPTLLTADPTATGSLRIDISSEDLDYRDRMRRAFADGMASIEFERELLHMSADEPLGPLRHYSLMTRERFGSLPRHYVRTLRDLALLPDAQNEMIREVDDAMGTVTAVHDLAAAHGPHLTSVSQLAEILLLAADVSIR
jgi:pimeloyl-ACP methyl ester carboxylesterase